MYSAGTISQICDKMEEMGVKPQSFKIQVLKDKESCEKISFTDF